MPRGRRQPPQCSNPLELVMAGDLISLRDWCMKSGANEETIRKAAVRTRGDIRRADSPVDQFPVPITILSVGGVYLESELDAWYENYFTWRPGRPKKVRDEPK